MMKKLYAFLLLIITILPWSSAMAAVAGKVLASTGEVSALRPAANGGAVQARKLPVGAVIYDNDTIITGNKAQVQLRFNDGTLFNLKSSSELRIDAYQYDPNNAGNNRSLFSLLKGGFRTITGFISRLQKNNYRVRTTVATIGIRGTDYSLQLCASDCPKDVANGLYAHVYSGGINITNDSGRFELDAGHSVHILDSKHGPSAVPVIPEAITGNSLPAPDKTESPELALNPEVEILDDLIFSTGEAIRCLQ